MGLFGRTSLVTAKMLSIGYRHKNKTKCKPLDTSESLSWLWRWGWHNVWRKELLGRIQYGFSNSWPKALVPQDNAYSHKVSEDGAAPGHLCAGITAVRLMGCLFSDRVSRARGRFRGKWS